MNKIQSLLQNKHTTAAAIVYLLATACKELGPVWWPSHTTELLATGRWLEGIAVVYGLTMAGDAQKTEAK